MQREDSLFPDAGGEGGERAGAGAAGAGAGAAQSSATLCQLLGGERSFMWLALSVVMSNLTPRTSVLSGGGEAGGEAEGGGGDGSKEARAKMGISLMLAHRVAKALQSVGCLPVLAGHAEGGQLGRGGGGGQGAGHFYSCVIKGTGKGLTCLVPVLSSSASAFQISPHVTGMISVSSSLLLDTCRGVAQAQNFKGVDVIAALLHFVVKELAVRLPHFHEADVMGLAQYWLTAPEASRSTAHVLLSSRLARADSAARHAIVQEWTARLREGGVGSGADEEARAGLVTGATSGFSGPDGAAIVVLAVIGSHFQESLDYATAERVAQRLARSVSGANLLHARVASHLLARGANLWSRHLKVSLFAPTPPLSILCWSTAKPHTHTFAQRANAQSYRPTALRSSGCSTNGYLV